MFSTSSLPIFLRPFAEHPVLARPFLGNSIGEYVVALFLFLLFLAVFKIFQLIVLARLRRLAERTKTDIDDALIRIVKSVRPPFYSFLAFYLAINSLLIAPFPRRVLLVALLVWVVYQVSVAIQLFVDFLVEKRSTEEGNGATQSALNVMGVLVKGVVWLLGILFILSNLGINITSVIAGLGIGGIAIAFALQNILSDLFSSFAIYFDKPFVPGDFIIVGEHMGVVQKIGIKTTRIRALQGEEIVIPNQELTSARVQNFKKMSERRIVFSFGVVYQTPIEKMQQIPNIVRDIFAKTEKARLDRVHFLRFDDSALTFEVVYYVEGSEYSLYMDIQQAVNLQIKAVFEKEGIHMAYPTQTVYIAKP